MLSKSSAELWELCCLSVDSYRECFREMVDCDSLVDIYERSYFVDFPGQVVSWGCLSREFRSRGDGDVIDRIENQDNDLLIRKLESRLSKGLNDDGRIDKEELDMLSKSLSFLVGRKKLSDNSSEDSGNIIVQVIGVSPSKGSDLNEKD